MKVTIQYYCARCKDAFAAYCTVPNTITQHSDACSGIMEFSGADGTRLLYMCSVCGHTKTLYIPDVIPAMASRHHGCGEECLPL